MKTIQGFIFALLLGCSATAIASELPALDMKAANELSPELITGGQPSLADLEKLEAAGVTTIISLRAPTEDAGFDEAEAAKSLGMKFVSIPVAGAGDISTSNAAKLDAALRDANGKTLLHCGSSNRVGALLALRAAAAGQSVEDAVAFGKSAGLTSLEQAVRKVLEEPTH